VRQTQQALVSSCHFIMPRSTSSNRTCYGLQTCSLPLQKVALLRHVVPYLFLASILSLTSVGCWVSVGAFSS